MLAAQKVARCIFYFYRGRNKDFQLNWLFYETSVASIRVQSAGISEGAGIYRLILDKIFGQKLISRALKKHQNWSK